MRQWQLVIDDTGSVEGIYAFIYCTKWRSGQVLPMPDSLTHSLTTLKDSATQLLIKYKRGALVKQKVKVDLAQQYLASPFLGKGALVDRNSLFSLKIGTNS